MSTDIDNTYTNKEFGDALKELMVVKNLSYNQLAYICHLSPQYLQQIVTKKVLPPKDENIIKIAQGFGLQPQYFREYRSRRLSEKMQNLDFHMDNYDVPLSPEEIAYLKKIIEQAEKE